MKNNRFSFLIPIFLISFILFLLCFPAVALAGAKSGLLIWFNSLLPSLLPFMIISGLLVSTGSALLCTSFIYPPLHFLFKTSREGTFTLLAGFLCGFPMAAKILADLRLENRISKKEGDFLLGFCNNFSPAFVLTVIAPIFSVPKLKIILIVLGSPILYGLVFAHFKGFSFFEPAKKEKIGLKFSFSMLDSSIMGSFSAITKIGGYLILFGIFAKMVTALPAATILKAYLISLTEITGGASFLAKMSCPEKLKALILLPGTVFGGLSGLAQTKSITVKTDLSIKSYLKAKSICSLLALLFTLMLL